MAAIVQTDLDKSCVSFIRYKAKTVSGTSCYGVQIGSIVLFQGNGDPNGEIYAPMGSFFVNNISHAFKKKTDAVTGTTWSDV